MEQNSPPSLDLGGKSVETDSQLYCHGSDESRLFICRILLRMLHDPHEKVAQSATQLRRQIISCTPDDSFIRDISGGLHVFEVDTKPKQKRSSTRPPDEDPFLIGITCNFFEWCFSRFKFPSGDEDEIDDVIEGVSFNDHFRADIGISAYNQRKNEISGYYEIVSAHQKLKIEEYEELDTMAKGWASKPLRVPGLVEKQIFNLKPRTCSKICFHPYEVGRIYSASRGEKSKTTWLQTWDASQMDKPLNSWQNGSKKSRTSARSQDASDLLVLNAFHEPILAVGSSDGSVRLWKDMHLNGQQSCVSAFRALSYPPRRNSNFGIRLLWNLQSQILTAAGCSSDVVRFWDITKEQCANEYHIGSNNATSMCGLPLSPHLTAVGFESGEVCIIDSREKEITAHISNLHPNSRVVKVSPHRHVLTTASINGRICFSDPRILRDNGPASQSFQIQSDRMDAFDAHPFAPLMAAKNRDRDGTFVSVYSTSNYDVKEICSIRYHRGFLGQRIGPVQSLQFNPHGCVLAIGAGELISLHSGNLEPDIQTGHLEVKRKPRRHRKQKSDPDFSRLRFIKSTATF